MIWRLKWSAIRLQGWSRNQARRNRWRQLLKAPNTPSGAKTSVHVTRCTSHPTAEFSRLIWELGSLAGRSRAVDFNQIPARVLFSAIGCRKDDDFRFARQRMIRSGDDDF